MRRWWILGLALLPLLGGAALGLGANGSLAAGVAQAVPADDANACAQNGPMAPMPLLSQGVPVQAGPQGTIHSLTDGDYAGGWQQTGCAVASPCSLRLTVHQSPAPRRIIVAWYNEATENYWRHNAQEITYGLVQDYAILVNGVPAVHITDNEWSRRTHLIDLAALGIQAEDLSIELRVNGLEPSSDAGLGAVIDELEVFDASAGHQDSWFLVGDSLVGAAFRPTHELAGAHFRDLAAAAGHHPLFIEGGVGAEGVVTVRPLLPQMLDRHPEICNWVLMVGTNDVWNKVADDSIKWFAESVSILANQVRAKGRRVFLATLPYGERGPAASAPFDPAVVASFNDQIRQVLNLEKFQEAPLAVPGPDFYPTLLPPENRGSDGVHPTTAGARAMNRALFDTARQVYAGARFDPWPGATPPAPPPPTGPSTPTAAPAECAPVAPIPDSPTREWFRLTAHTLADDPAQGQFRSYWLRYGGIEQFGYPITEPAQETNPTDGHTYWTQWFERNRFEYHPDAPPEYRTLMGLLGAELLHRQGTRFAPGSAADCAAPDCAWFAPTDHSLRGVFRAYWEVHGGLPIFGYPLSEVVQENGRPVQYFERNRFEYHAENAGTRYEVLLGLLGRQLSGCR
jgi:hypothetical protein